MDRAPHKRLLIARTALAALAILFISSQILLYNVHQALGAEITDRSLSLYNAQASASTTYKVGFTIATAATLGSIRVQFCSNSPIIGQPCTAPSGFDVSSATLSAQTGETGFSIGSGTTANVLILTRSPTLASTQAVSYTIDNVINPDTEGPYYARVETFASTDASGSNTDYGGLAFSISRSLQVSTEVPPFIIFCAGVTIPAYNCSNTQGSLVDLGSLNNSHTSDGQSQVLVATNASNGYSLYMDGTTLTSGNNAISSLNSPSAVFLGVNQFGINLRSNLSPAVGQDPAGPGLGVPTADYDQPDRYKFSNGDLIAGYSAAEDFRRYTVSYIADVNSAQAAGVYVSTITYVCVGNF